MTRRRRPPHRQTIGRRRAHCDRYQRANHRWRPRRPSHRDQPPPDGRRRDPARNPGRSGRRCRLRRHRRGRPRQRTPPPVCTGTGTAAAMAATTSAVLRHAGAGRVEVDDMDRLPLQRGERLGDRIVAIDGLLAVVALVEPDAFTVAEIDRGNRSMSGFSSRSTKFSRSGDRSAPISRDGTGRPTHGRVRPRPRVGRARRSPPRRAWLSGIRVHEVHPGVVDQTLEHRMIDNRAVDP